MKKYKEIELDIIRFETEDVINDSSCLTYCTTDGGGEI